MIRSCWNHYHAPETIAEAVALLGEYDGRAQVLGGGTDLLLEIQQGSKPPLEAVIDPSRIPGLNAIEERGQHLVIGCSVTHTMIIDDDRIRRRGTCLAEGCGVIGGPQVRNVGTLAGNVAHALPAADGTIALLALGGEVEITGPGVSRWIPLPEAFAGPGKSALDLRNMLITRLRFPSTGANESSTFHRIMRPQGVALPMVTMACRLGLDNEGRVGSVRISIGPLGPVPYLAEPAMETLRGARAIRKNFERATATLLDSMKFRSSKYRASAAYREAMVRTHLPALLERTARRAADAGKPAP